MYCQNCGTELAAGTKFCSNCGTEQKNIFVNKTSESSKRKKKKVLISIVIVVLLIVAVVVPVGIVNYDKNNLTLEEARIKFLEAQDVYLEWYTDPPISYSDSFEDQWHTYYLVKGEFKTEDIIEILSEHFTYEICEEVIDICYLQKKDKLYFGAVPFGVETVTTIIEDRIYKENDCWIYEVDVECRDSIDNSIVYTDTPVFKLVKQNKDWVFDSFSIYDTLLKYE